MDLGSRLRSEEADPAAGFAVLRSCCGGWRGRRVQDSSRTALLALLLLGRALLFARPRLWLLGPWQCWQMSQGPRMSGKGDYSFQGASLLSLERCPGLQ